MANLITDFPARLPRKSHENINVAGNKGQKGVKISVAAVFDGHGGQQASVLASENFLDYFFLHVVFINYKRAFQKESVVENHREITAERLVNRICKLRILLYVIVFVVCIHITWITF